jgi:hypothetical protein
VAWHHLASVKLQDSRNAFEILDGARQQLIRGVRLVRVGPEDDDVREHDD